VASVAFAPGNSMTLAAGDNNGTTYLWNTAAGRVTARLPDPAPSTQGVTAVAFAPDGTLATADGSGEAFLWDLTTRKATLDFGSPAGVIVTSLTWEPDSGALAVGDSTGQVNLCVTSDPYGSYNTYAVPGGGRVNSMAWVRAGSDFMLAIGDRNGTTYLRDTTNFLYNTHHANPGGASVSAVAFTPDGTILATGDGRGTITLWHVSRYRP
jgi:WD40 repeat protein